MTRLKDGTFEGASLTGTNGASSVVATPTLDATSLIKGTYSVGVSASTQYARFDVTPSGDIYVSLYIYITAAAASIRSIYIQNGCRVDIRSNRALRLSDSTGTQQGSDSAVLSLNTLYRVGIHWRKATIAGNDGQAEAYVTATGFPDAAFGTAFATSTTLTNAADQQRVDVGNTSSASVNTWFFDNVRIDNAAMPTDDVAGGIDTPKAVTVTVGNSLFIQKKVGKFATVTPTTTATMSKTLGLARTISTSLTGTASIRRAINFTKSVSSAVTTAISKARAMTFSVAVGNVLTAGKGYAKTITRTVPTVASATRGFALTFTTTATAIASFTKGMVTLKTITVTVGKSVSVLKNIGKPILRTVSAIASRNINQPKTIQVSLVGIPSIQKNIGKPITYISNIVFSGAKLLYKNISVIANTSLSIRKNILKPVSVTVSKVVSLAPKAIGKTISRSVGSVVTVIYGKSYLIFATVVSNTSLISRKAVGKTIAVVTATQSSARKTINLLITVAANTSASIQRNIRLTIKVISNAIAIFGRDYQVLVQVVVSTAVQLAPKAISKVILYTSNVNTIIRKGFALTITVVSEVAINIFKVTGTELMYAQMNRDIRRITLGIKNTALDILGKNRRAITLKDREDDNS